MIVKSELRVEIIEKINREDYNSLLDNTASTFFHSFKFLQLLKTLLKVEIGAIEVRENYDMTGILPYFIKKTKFGDVINSLPYFGSYGGVLTQKNKNAKVILEKFNELNKEKDVLSSVIIENPFNINNEIYEKYFHYNYTDSRITQCTKLDLNETELFSKFEKRVRWSIKKADKHNIKIKKSELNEKINSEFFHYHKKNMESKDGKFKSLDFFHKIEKIFEVGKDYDVYIGLKDEMPISFLLVFYFKNYTEYYMPAQNLEMKEFQASSKLIWESMRESIKKNIVYYNFGGTPKNNLSLYRFKKGWNSEDYSYKYYIYADIKKIQECNLDELKKSFQNFFIIPYDIIQNGN